MGIIFILGACALFSKTWAEISGQSPANVYKQLKDQGYTGIGGDYTLKKRLQLRINTASLLSGIFVGTLTIVADFLVPSYQELVSYYLLVLSLKCLTNTKK